MMPRVLTTPARFTRRDLLGAALAAGAAAATTTRPVLARLPAPPAIAGNPDDLFQELREVVARRMAEWGYRVSRSA